MHLFWVCDKVFLLVFFFFSDVFFCRNINSNEIFQSPKNCNFHLIQKLFLKKKPDDETIAKKLIEKGANVNAKDFNGWTLLQKTVWEGKKLD